MIKIKNNQAIKFLSIAALGVIITILGVSLIANANEEKKPWNIRCAENTNHCEMVQRLNVTETGQRIIEFAITHDKETKSAKGAVILPLGVLIQPGVNLAIDDDKRFRFEINHCLANGCYAYIEMPEAIIESFKKGNNAVLVMKDTKGTNVQIPLSLDGFTKAFERL